jgi:hypothetical protein
MDTIHLPKDFKEFLQLLKTHEVEYLLIGGFAVSYHGYPRTTLDMDFLITLKQENIDKLRIVLKDFGFGFREIFEPDFWQFGKIIRMGNPPMRIELISKASGIEFDECFKNRTVDFLDGIEVNIISLEDLKKNKIAAGRHKDLNDIENLP